MAHIRTRDSKKDGPRYDVRFVVNGKDCTKTFRVFEDAKNYKKRIEGEEQAGLVIDPKGGERLFGPYADAWLDHRLVKGKPLTPTTRQGYKALMRRHITPAFDATKLRQITPERVRKWHTEVTAKSQDQGAKSYRLLRAILTTAVSDELIARNPCTIKGAGIEQARERPMVETKTVLALADAILPRLHCLVLLAGLGGLRAGELLGLQRRDIDPLHNTVTVARQAHEITGQGRVITTPKSDAGNRELQMPEFVMEALETHLKSYVATAPDSPVFTRKTGLPLRRQDLSHEWSDACTAVGIKGVTIHDLRHHALTVVARDPNVTTRELMAYGGHSSSVAALRYQHATTERGKAIASYLDGVVAAVKSAPESAAVSLRP
jgi:integrase